MTIFDLLTSTEIAAYWTTLAADEPPYLGEELFPSEKKLGLDLKWIKGAQGLPIVLAASAFDSRSKSRDRIGFDKLSAEMPFFKESVYIDEVIRQELNLVLATGNQTYIDAVMNRVFADQMALLRGARAQRERMRMQALTTGLINISSNGQALSYDYHVPADNKQTVTTSWATTTTDIIADIRKYQDQVEDATGVRPTRGLVSRKTFGYFLANEIIRKSIYVLTNGVGTINEAKVKSFLMDELDLEIVIYTKRFLNEAKQSVKFVPDDTFVLFPSGDLGKTHFGTTPEESDLMSGSSANVSITDLGVAVTTIKHEDPVTVETKVTMICLPSFEAADHVVILDVIP